MFTHFDEKGQAIMVDVSQKTITEREALAKGKIRMKKTTLELIEDGGVTKGDVLGIARVGGIMGGKETSSIIPLCHNIPLSHLSIEFYINYEESSVEISALAKTTYKTGVEMEALMAVSTTALIIYDMCKGVDKSMCIEGIHLSMKKGGKSGEFNFGEKDD